MTKLTFADEAKHMINIYRAARHNSKKRFVKATAQVEKALRYGDRAPYYSLALALDADVKFKEGKQIREGRARLFECNSAIGNNKDPDASYISAHCHVWLAISDEKVGYAQIEAAALSANMARKGASRFVQSILHEFPLEVLKRVCGQRKSSPDTSDSLDGPNRVSVTKIEFDL